MIDKALISVKTNPVKSIRPPDIIHKYV
jgi:hypothetical protein